MNHTEIQDKLFALYDGELDGDARHEVEVHLVDCSECRQRYTQWQQTARALFQPPRIEVSEPFVYQVMDRLAVLEHPRHGRQWIRAIQWLVPAVGLAGLLFFVAGPAQRAISIETLLLGEGQENAPSQLVLASEPPNVDEVLGSIMEGSP